jgi:uncharacterized protein YdeI (YjbR/CyaY-like superfamily)
MPKKNTLPEVDTYIANAADFARPILKKLRKLFHAASPKITETVKWGMPFFEHQGIVGTLGAFKHHVAFGFWKGSLLSDPHGVFTNGRSPKPMGVKVQSVAELPPDEVLLELIREAVALNEQGVTPPKPPRKKVAKPIVVPEILQTALAKNAKARKTFENFPPSHQREYIEWITEAKQESTRQRRLTTTLEWLAEGKSRNWKYETRKKSG